MSVSFRGESLVSVVQAIGLFQFVPHSIQGLHLTATNYVGVVIDCLPLSLIFTCVILKMLRPVLTCLSMALTSSRRRFGCIDLIKRFPTYLTVQMSLFSFPFGDSEFDRRVQWY